MHPALLIIARIGGIAALVTLGLPAAIHATGWLAGALPVAAAATTGGLLCGGVAYAAVRLAAGLHF